MPNWVFNTIEIRSSNRNQLKQIEELLDGPNGRIDFNKLIPMPKHDPDKFWAEGPLSMETEERLGKENCWYWWSVDNWGTKWNACDIGFSKGNGLIHYEFNTAWSEPDLIFKKLIDICKLLGGCDVYIDFEEEQGWGGVLEYNSKTEDLNEYGWSIDDISKEYKRLKKKEPDIDGELWNEAINICRDRVNNFQV